MNKLASTDTTLWTHNDVAPSTTIFPNNKTGFGAVTAGWRNKFGIYAESYGNQFKINDDEGWGEDEDEDEGRGRGR